MKTHAGLFLAGLIVGFVLCTVLVEIWKSMKGPEPDSTLDALIEEWTEKNLPLEAGFEASHEIADVRVGFIPDTVAKLADHIDSTYKIPKGVVLAQWILESRWGLNDLGASNYFGHTFQAVEKFMDDPRYVLLREKVTIDGKLTSGKLIQFARYANIAQSFETHGRYVSRSPIYRAALKQKSKEQFARRMGAHYAEDPDYALKLITIMRRYDL